MSKQHKKIYYCGGFISLIGLPILLFAFYQHQIDNLLRKSTIEFVLPVIDGSFIGHLETFPEYRAKYKEYRYEFYPENESGQIEAFRLFHHEIEVNSTNDNYYFVVTVNPRCSYNLFIQVLDILDQLKYKYEYRGNVLYAKRMTREWTAQAIKYKTNEHSTDIEEFKNLFLQISQIQQFVIILIGVFWLIMLIIIIRSRRNVLSAT